MEADLLPRLLDQKSKETAKKLQFKLHLNQHKTDDDSPRHPPIVNLQRKGFTGRLRIEVGNAENPASPRNRFADIHTSRDLLLHRSPVRAFRGTQAEGRRPSAIVDGRDSMFRPDEVVKNTSRTDGQAPIVHRVSSKVTVSTPVNTIQASTAAERQISYAGDGIAFKEVEATQEVIDALGIAGKERIYAELSVLTSFLETITAEPFASMDEFEKLKAATLCTVESYAHQEIILEMGKQLENSYLCLQGSIAVFDFAIPISKFEKEKEDAIISLVQQSSLTGKDVVRSITVLSQGQSGNELQKAIKDLQEDWSVRFDVVFKSNFSILEKAGSGTLPEGTRFWILRPGAVFGSGFQPVGAGHSKYLVMINNSGSGQTLKLASLSRLYVNISKPYFAPLTIGLYTGNKWMCDAFVGRYHEKAQILRSSKLFTGVTKLTIKMLATQLQEQTIGPNTVVVPQDTAPTNLFVVKRGYLRVVRTLGRSNNENTAAAAAITRASSNKGSISHRQPGELLLKKLPQNIEGKAVEVGLIGPTHFFGALSVLEHGHINLSPAHLISCSVIDVYTLARADVGKISYEDRETMIANARRLEIFIQNDLQIAEQLKAEKQWSVFKASLLKNVVARNTTRKKQALGCFETGVASGGCMRKYEKKESPQILPQTHPFQVLGSVVIGYY